nr:hypothetical protein [uncultured Acetobacteroides sp.]
MAMLPPAEFPLGQPNQFVSVARSRYFLDVGYYGAMSLAARIFGEQ